MFSRWGEFAYQHRRVIPLVVVAVIILLYLTFGMRLSDRMSQEGWDDPNSDSTTAAAIEARTFGRDNNGDVILLFTAETGTIDESPEFGHIQEYLPTSWPTTPTRSTTSPAISTSGSTGSSAKTNAPPSPQSR